MKYTPSGNVSILRPGSLPEHPCALSPRETGHGPLIFLARGGELDNYQKSGYGMVLQITCIS